MNHFLNTLLVALVTLVVAGAGYYQIEVAQPRALQQIDEQKKLARLQQAQMEQLFAEEANSAERAEETMRKWHARYKYIPEQLKTPDVIQYLEGLTASGFEQFAVRLASQSSTPDFGYYLFEVSGTAYFPSLYRFIWQIENNRAFYQVLDLDLAHTNVFERNEDTQVQARRDMVNFSMRLKAFFGGTQGLSAPLEDLIEVPKTLLPAEELTHDSFFPIVRTDLPPNDQLLLDVENATLLSIVGDRAVFQDKNGQHVVRVGDKVYLGRIVYIDPYQATVRASLNKGGIEEVVDVKMESEDVYKKAQEQDIRLIPLDKQQQ